MDCMVHGVTKSQTRLSDFHLHFSYWVMGFPGSLAGKESACNEGDLSSIPGLGRSHGGRHSNPIPVFLPGESPWTEEPGRLQSMRLQRVGHD